MIHINDNFLFSTTLKSTQDFHFEELKQLDLEPRKSYCGSYLSSSWEHIFKANFYSRTSQRVLLNLFKAVFKHQDHFYKIVKRYNWESLIQNESDTICIHFSGKCHMFKNTMYACQKAKDAICDKLREHHGWRPSIDKDNATYNIYLHANRNTIHVYLDTSGAPLSQRGYRPMSYAPLSEIIAASIVMKHLPSNTENMTIIDPMCGGGTFLFEALMQTMDVPPGFFRDEYAFMSFLDFDIDKWNGWRAQQNVSFKKQNTSFLGIDKDKDLEESVTKQINRYELNNLIKVFHNQFQNQRIPVEKGIIFTNPPFGIRIKHVAQRLFDDVITFYKRYARVGFMIVEKDMITKYKLNKYFSSCDRFTQSTIDYVLLKWKD
jgi:putative N6-adenine-specific DNA methylase